MPHRPLTLFRVHASQHPALTGGSVGMISGENPRFPAEMQGHEALRNELDRLGLDHEETTGKYGGPERSFIVHNPDLQTMRKLGSKFGQESIAFSQNGRHQLHFTAGPHAGMATPPAEGHSFSEKEPEDFYTAIPGPKGEPYGYFSWNMDFENPKVPSQGRPPTPKPAPVVKSEPSLITAVKGWIEQLGELRTRELAKAEKSVTETDREIAIKSAGEEWKAIDDYNDRSQRAKDPKLKRIFDHARKEEEEHLELLNAYLRGEHPELSKSEVMAKTAPPGFSEERMHRLKREYGLTGAFKVAWSIHNKGKKKDMKKGLEEDINAEAARVGAQAVKPANYARATPAARKDIMRTLDARPTASSKVPKAKVVVKREDAGSAIGMISGDITKINKKSEVEEPQMSESSKRDPLDTAHYECAGCKAPMSPIVAALRKGHGGMCLKCASMNKGELKYVNNEPQHQEADTDWNIKGKEGYKAVGSGGETKKGPKVAESNDGSKSTQFPLKAGAPKTSQHAGPAQTLTKEMDKAEGMSVPKAPGAGAGMGGSAHAGGSSPPKVMPLGRSESMEKVAPPGREEQVKKLKHKDVKNPWAVAWASYNKTHKKAELSKALTEAISLRKATDPNILRDMRQASYEAAQGSPAVPAAGKIAPKDPSEYDAAAFRPASPGAAGVQPSGLELDTTKRTYAPGHKPVEPTNPLSTKPVVTSFQSGGLRPAPKQVIPVHKMRNIRGAPTKVKP